MSSFTSYLQLSKRIIFRLSITLLVILSVGCSSSKYATVKEAKEHPLCADPTYSWNKNLSPAQIKANPAIKKAVTDYIRLNEQMLSHREQVFMGLESVKTEYSQDNPIPSKLLNRLNKKLVTSVNLAYQYEDVLQDNYCWYDNLKAEKQDYSSFIGFMLELSSALTLYDTYMQVFSVTHENQRLSRFLNQGDDGYKKPANSLFLYTQNIQDLANIKRLEEQVLFYQQNIKHYDLLTQYPRLWYLKLNIEQSPTFQRIPEMEFSNVISKRFSNNVDYVTYDLEELNRSAINGISSFFGNVTGLFEARTGYLYDSPEVLANVTSHLQAGDILLEKTPFRLTDKVIPGYWGHAAVWIGNEQELKALGIWDHPIVSKYHQQIKEGRLVAEALRTGVQLSPLEHFMNIDDLALIRVKNQTKERKQQVIIDSLRQIGKEYDFNYDIETTDRIVCSQLVYIAYDDINWSTDKVMGRYTISPDAIAKQALHNSNINIELLYINSNKVESELSTKMHQVLQSEQ